MLGAQWVARPCRPGAGTRGPGFDGQDRRRRAGAPAALRAGAGEPRAAELEHRARRPRHGAHAHADPRRQEDHAALPRRAGPRQRAHDLADLGRLSRSRAPAGGLVRAAQRLPQLPHRPRRGRRSISTRNIRSGATCCAQDGGRAWSGARQRTRERDGRRSPPSTCRARARAAAPAAAIRRTGRASDRERRGACRIPETSSTRANPACAARAIAVRRCGGRSESRRPAAFTRCGRRCAAPACRETPNARWRGGNSDCR